MNMIAVIDKFQSEKAGAKAKALVRSSDRKLVAREGELKGTAMMQAKRLECGSC
jgi:hypothetical protein